MEDSVNNFDGSYQLPGPLSSATSEYSSEEDSDDAHDDISQLQRKIWSAQDSSSEGSKSFVKC